VGTHDEGPGRSPSFPPGRIEPKPGQEPGLAQPRDAIEEMCLHNRGAQELGIVIVYRIYSKHTAPVVAQARIYADRGRLLATSTPRQVSLTGAGRRPEEVELVVSGVREDPQEVEITFSAEGFTTPFLTKRFSMHER